MNRGSDSWLMRAPQQAVFVKVQQLQDLRQEEQHALDRMRSTAAFVDALLPRRYEADLKVCTAYSATVRLWQNWQHTTVRREVGRINKRTGGIRNLSAVGRDVGVQ